MAKNASTLSIVARWSGLTSVWTTGRDAWLVIACRSSRMFAFGAASLVLALFFAELHVSDARIGLFMTLTLVGDIVLGTLLTLVADRVGRRRVLTIGSVFMVLSGVVLVTCENYWLLLFAAVIGVVSATGGDFGPFRAVEESIMSELTNPETRPDVLAWYVTASSLGSAIGTELCGRFVEWLSQREGWTLLATYHACFWAYSIVGVFNFIASLLLSRQCELKPSAVRESAGESRESDDTELEPFMAEGEGESASKPQPISEKPKASPLNHFARISKETRRIMYALWFLLMVDSLADGMTPMSLTIYYMDHKFHPAKSTLGDFLSIAHFLASCSGVFAGPLARAIGLVNTMVFTHIPSSTAVLLFPFPQSLWLTFALLLLRQGLNNMDQAPRAALIAAVVKPEERTAVLGITSTLRTLAATTGPTITGLLAGSDRFWIAFVVAGVLRLAYDIGLFVMFINIKLHRHEPVPQKAEVIADHESDASSVLDARRRSNDEDSLDGLA